MSTNIKAADGVHLILVLHNSSCRSFHFCNGFFLSGFSRTRDL